MMNVRDIRLYLAAMAMLLLAVLVSCSRVEYGYIERNDDLHKDPTISTVKFSFDWQNVKDTTSLPSELTVAMSRVVNTVHYVYTLDKDGAILDSTSVGSAPDHEPDTVLNGDYYVLALARDNAHYEYELPDIDMFEDSLAISMKDLYARIPQVSQAELVAADVVDFNPLYPFIYSAEPLYFEVKKQGIYPADGPNEIVMTPQALTRKITFMINVRTEKGVRIDRLIGIISGVPSDVQLMSGVVSEYNTSKVFFDMEQVFSEKNNYKYQGSVNVLGLFPASKPGFITGPGIFQVILNVSIGSGDDLVRRVFYASINIKELIEKSDLMIQTTDHIGYRSTGTDEVMLQIGTELKVTKEQVESGGGQGHEEWIENETDIEVEV